MKLYFLKITLLLFSVSFIGCKQNSEVVLTDKKCKSENTIHYATGLSITNHKGFSIVIVSNPWPKTTKKFTYILKEKNGIIPDSLQQFTTIQVPIQSIVVTSTTHVPSLEMLGIENSLIGFPNLNYISSDKVRTQIEKGKVIELGNNTSLNTEKIINLQPDIIVGYGLDNNNPTLDNLQKSGLKVVLNGDWNETSPLGKAEWIKLFGALYCKQVEANKIFTTIEKEYLAATVLAKKQPQNLLF
ncbi:ABC transporter substrate-binding protein [Flavobacterium myungsuense]|uniref:ABC transporter substrate-binding protein n=1 Tax=Flavobacterium myungsuense TaxID=651823 RepID=UPI003628B9DC